MVFEDLSFRAAVLLAVVLIGGVLWRTLRSKRRASVALPTLPVMAQRSRSLRARLHALPDALRVAALVLLLIAFARPREGEERVHVSSEGVAVMMLVDRSSSMEQPMQYAGEERSRLDVVKSVFQSFVLGGEGLPGRPGDLIGLSSFARFVEHNCPLTLDHESLGMFLKNIAPANPVEDGTSIGDALRHAALSLIAGTESTDIKSKFIVILSDGEQTAGELLPVEGARIAASHGIKVHCIFVAGPTQSRQTFDPFGVFREPEPTGEELRQVAQITGGTFSTATDGSSLLEITRRLDKAEKTEIEEKIVRFKERFELPLLIGLWLLMAELVFRATWLLRIP
jgi:Ca-activated chloride channel family protein